MGRGGARHSKQAATKPYFSAAERAEADRAGYGTKRQRLGADALREFGHCCLTHAVVVEPVVSPKGDLFSRAAVVEYLALRKLEEREAKQKYKAALKAREQQGASASASATAAALEEFQRAESGMGSGGAAAALAGAQTAEGTHHISQGRFVTPRGAILVPQAGEAVPRPAVWAHSIGAASSAAPVTLPQMTSLGGVDADAAESKQVEMLQAETQQVRAFWIPAHVPAHHTAELAPPKKTTVHPWGEYQLKLKDLTTVNFTEQAGAVPKEDIRLQEGGSSTSAGFMCPVSRKSFGRASRVAVIKPSGYVVSMEVIDTVVRKDMTCPVTGVELVESDIIVLKASGTGFSSRGGESVEAKKTVPAGQYS